MPLSMTDTLLKCPIDTKKGLVPYGFNRTIVVIEALLRKMDILFFVDSDIYPVALKKTKDGIITEEIDFFGEHLKHLKGETLITTGEYSGYNILPPAMFDGMEDLLAGLQKSEMTDYWRTSETHRSLMYQPDIKTAKPCSKILGGNTAIKLSAFSVLPPFFSTYYSVGNEMFLCRGEDTVLGAAIAKSGLPCTDIGLNPLHDTYKNYPKEPNLHTDKDVQERFYYACTGWVGRNPFLNYLIGNDLEATKEYQKMRLIPGLQALSDYTSNPKFNTIIKNFEESWKSLDGQISEYEKVLEAWSEFTKRIVRRYDVKP